MSHGDEAAAEGGGGGGGAQDAVERHAGRAGIAFGDGVRAGFVGEESRHADRGGGDGEGGIVDEDRVVEHLQRGEARGRSRLCGRASRKHRGSHVDVLAARGVRDERDVVAVRRRQGGRGVRAHREGHDADVAARMRRVLGLAEVGGAGAWHDRGGDRADVVGGDGDGRHGDDVDVADVVVASGDRGDVHVPDVVVACRDRVDRDGARDGLRDARAVHMQAPVGIRNKRLVVGVRARERGRGVLAHREAHDAGVAARVSGVLGPRERGDGRQGRLGRGARGERRARHIDVADVVVAGRDGRDGDGAVMDDPLCAVHVRACGDPVPLGGDDRAGRVVAHEHRRAADRVGGGGDVLGVFRAAAAARDAQAARGVDLQAGDVAIRPGEGRGRVLAHDEGDGARGGGRGDVVDVVLRAAACARHVEGAGRVDVQGRVVAVRAAADRWRVPAHRERDGADVSGRVCDVLGELRATATARDAEGA